MARRKGPEPIVPLDPSRISVANVPLDLIDEHPANANTHSDDQISDLARSLEQIGQYRSVVIWARPNGRYLAIAGFGTISGAREKGDATIRAEIHPVDANEAALRAALIADNEHARHSVLDETRFADLLESSRLAGYDLHALGSSEEDLDALKARLADAFLGRDGGDPDEAEAQDNPEDAGWGGDEDDEDGASARPKRDQDRRDGPLDDEDAAGTQLAKLTLSFYQPKHVVSRGDIIWLSAPDCPRQHVLLCVDPHRDWPLWQPYLPRLVAEGVGETRARQVIYAQFPDPLLPLSRRARHLRMVLVQPDRYLAGHLLDKVAEVWGEGSLAREYATPRAGAATPAAETPVAMKTALRLVGT